MKVTLVAHFEWVEDVEETTWWADSPDAPGFYAAAPSLGQLQREASEALVWSSDEPPEIEWATEGDVPAWAASHIALNSGGLASPYATGVGPQSHHTFQLFGARVAVRFGPEGARNFSLNV